MTTMMMQPPPVCCNIHALLADLDKNTSVWSLRVKSRLQNVLFQFLFTLSLFTFLKYFSVGLPNEENVQAVAVQVPCHWVASNECIVGVHHHRRSTSPPPRQQHQSMNGSTSVCTYDVSESATRSATIQTHLGQTYQSTQASQRLIFFLASLFCSLSTSIRLSFCERNLVGRQVRALLHGIRAIIQSMHPSQTMLKRARRCSFTTRPCVWCQFCSTIGEACKNNTEKMRPLTVHHNTTSHPHQISLHV